ncbi:unnamed protein product, partial [Rotaria socialis]
MATAVPSTLDLTEVKYPAISDVREVSTRFEFFQPGFAYMVVLNFIFVVLEAEFCAESNGVIFKGGCRSKSGTLPGNTAFSENLVE